jgi:hypothetical protein
VPTIAIQGFFGMVPRKNIREGGFWISRRREGYSLFFNDISRIADSIDIW